MSREADHAARAVLFADISGSVSLYANRGDTVAFDLIDRCLGLVEQHVTLHDGRVIKRAGDAVLAEFDDAARAVCAAADMLQAVEDPSRGLHSEGVHVRVGISYGTVVRVAGDIYGDRVNVAARLLSLAGPDEILISEPVYEVLPDEMRKSARLIHQVALRGHGPPVPVFGFAMRTDGATVSRRSPVPVGHATLSLQYGEGRFVIDPARPTFRLGRASDNDLVIAGEVISRHHAEISLRGDKFVLKDRSTNGTEVVAQGGPKLRVCREEVALVGSGRIALGGAADQQLQYVVGRSG
jgi:class 3 adenylate cyclase